MGTTLGAIQSGKANLVYVAAIEGFSRLITDGPLAAVVTAWAGTDWSAAVGGLYRDIATKQTFDPWNPIGGGGGCTLSIVPDATEALAIEMARTDTMPDTQITASVNRTATTINVKNALDFPASGTAFMGNECFSYSACAATTFTVTQRGLYSPFGSGGVDTVHWAGEHRISAFDQFTTDVPIVSQFRKNFRGAWVGVWAHRVVGGVLDTKAQAVLVFAGQIDEYGQDTNDTTVIHCTHLLDLVRDRVIGSDQFSARAAEGIYLTAGGVLGDGVENDGTTTRTPGRLRVVASGASTPDQVNQGYYSIPELIDIFNAWFEYERATLGFIVGFYSLTAESVGNGNYIIQHARFSTGANSSVFWKFTSAFSTVLVAFGVINPVTFGPGGSVSGGGDDTILQGQGNGATDYTRPNPLPIKRVSAARFQLDQIVGTYVDQANFIPQQFAGYLPIDGSDGTLGLFIAGNNKAIMIGSIVGNEFFGWITSPGGPGLGTGNVPAASEIGVDTSFTITQILALSSSCYVLLYSLFFSTGTLGYQGIPDLFSSGYGMNIPGALMQNFAPTLVGAPGHSMQETLWIQKPTKFVDLLRGDLILRGLHLVWRNGGIEWAVWSTPIAQLATLALTEDNKAEPSGETVSQAPVVLRSADWAKPIVNIKYDYNPLDDTFAPPFILIDSVGVDILGGGMDPQVVELKTLGSGQSARDALALLLGGQSGGDIGFVSKWLPFASRPLGVMTRSLALPLFEGVAPGDVAAVTDAQARDPATGTKGMSNVPALLLSYSTNHGGLASSGGTNTMAGEVDLMVMAVNRSSTWSPAADVDETANSGGFTAGYSASTKTIRCKATSYSETGELADAARWDVNNILLVTEVDPTNPLAPLQWIVTVTGVSGNDITMFAALTSPAFDTTKTYRVTSSDYNDVGSLPNQAADVYQADATTAIVQDFRQAYQWGLAGISTITPTPPVHTDRCEYIAASSYSDGAAMDPGNHRSIARTINNLIDHRTAHQSPSLGQTVMSGAATGGYQLVWMAKKFFGIGRYGAGYTVKRSAFASILFNSNKNTSTTARITLSRNPIAAGYVTEETSTAPGYSWTNQFSQGTVTVLTSAGWTVSGEVELDLSVLDNDGCAWLSLELQSNGDSRGFVQCIERERT